MKFSPSEATFIALIANAGGSYCPGASAVISRDTHKLIRRLERQGMILVEQTDDGERFRLVEARHG